MRAEIAYDLSGDSEGGAGVRVIGSDGSNRGFFFAVGTHEFTVLPGETLFVQLAAISEAFAAINPTPTDSPPLPTTAAATVQVKLTFGP